MRILEELGRGGVAVASTLVVVAAAIVMTSCKAGSAGVEEPAQAQVNSPQAPERVEPWKSGRLIEAGELANVVSNPATKKPLILNAGPGVLYRKAHIPGAKYVGPASEPDGLTALQAVTQSIGKDEQIVLYCGCCPWNVCPNIRPAYTKLQQLGFSRVKVLHLPDNLTLNWVKKGFPVEKGVK